MTDLLTGELVSVEERQAGTYLVGAHSSGVSTLNVASVAELPESGSVIIGADTLDFTATAELTVDSVVGSSPTVTLSAATVNAYTDREPVVLTPTKAYKLALVVPNGGTVAIECLVSHAMHDRLAEGQRLGSGETVVLTKRQHGLVVTDVIGKAPAVDGGYLDPNAPITPGAVTSSWDTYPDEWVNRLRANFIQTGELSADVIVTGSVTSGGRGGQGTTVQNAQGFYTAQPDGTPRTVLPNDPTQPDTFRGVADFEQARVSQGIAMGGASSGESGGSFTLQTSIQPPTLSPTVVTSWPTATYAGPQKPDNKYGLAMRSPTQGYTLILRNDVRAVAEFNPSTGVYVGAYKLTGAPTAAEMYAGITWSAVRSRIYTLEWAAGAWWVRSYSAPSGSSCAYLAQWQWTDGAPLTTGNRPAITCANIFFHDFIYIAQSQLNGTVKIRDYDGGTSGTPIFPPTISATVTSTATLNLGDLVAVANTGGSVALAGLTAWLDGNGNPALPVVAMGTSFPPYGTGDTLGSLQVGNGNAAAAGASTLDGDPISNRTWYLSRADQSVIQHSNVFEAGLYWAQIAWNDSATGHKTLPSPAIQITKIAGSQVTVGISNLPAGVDSAALYLGKGSSFPGNSSMWLQNNPPAAGQTDVVVFGVATSGNNPVTVATLTGGTPFSIKAANGTVLMDGSGYVAGGGGALGVDDDVFFAANGDIIVTARA